MALSPRRCFATCRAVAGAGHHTTTALAGCVRRHKRDSLGDRHRYRAAVLSVAERRDRYPGRGGSVISKSHYLVQHAGVYTVTVTNALGSVTSQPATLNVRPPPPEITGQPQDVTVREGDWSTFCVGINNWRQDTSFQWLKNGVPVPDGTNSCLEITNTFLGDDGLYSVIVSNGVSFAASHAARLAVLPLGPLDFGDSINVSGTAATCWVSLTATESLSPSAIRFSSRRTPRTGCPTSTLGQSPCMP